MATYLKRKVSSTCERCNSLVTELVGGSTNGEGEVHVYLCGRCGYYSCKVDLKTVGREDRKKVERKEYKRKRRRRVKKKVS
jgi:hypothetical protein